MAERGKNVRARPLRVVQHFGYPVVTMVLLGREELARLREEVQAGQGAAECACGRTTLHICLKSSKCYGSTRRLQLAVPWLALTPSTMDVVSRQAFLLLWRHRYQFLS